MSIIKKSVGLINTIFYKVKYRNKIIFSGAVCIKKSRKKFYIEKGKMLIGKSFSIKEDAYFAVLNGGALTIGNNVSFNSNCTVVCHDTITIGDNCAFGPNTLIYDHDHKFGYYGLEKGFKTSPVVIGANCWIGGNVTILRGANIGDGCVIGAGTVVKGDIPSNSIVTSNRDMIITPMTKK